MDPYLEEKAAFFERFDAYHHRDADDTLGFEERIYRQKFREFSSATSSTPAKPPCVTDGDASRLFSATPERMISDLIRRDDSYDSDVEIIVVAPRSSTSRAAGLDSMADHAPGTATTAAKQSLRRPTRPLLRGRHLSPRSDSPPPKKGKRKKDGSLELVPEERQIFKGLSFYYVPNDDIGPVRKFQIGKARQHGATWSRDLVDATHIIVDKNLAYADIERHLRDVPNLAGKVLVNADYPMDCLSHHIIANPTQRQYAISGMPTSSSLPEDAAPSLSDPDTPPQPKPRRKKAVRRTRLSVPNTSSEQCMGEIKAANDGNGLGDEPSDPDDATRPSTADEADVSSDSGKPRRRRLRIRRVLDIGKSSGQVELKWQDKFLCMKSGTRSEMDNKPNAETIKVLQEMADRHSLDGEEFRVRAYRFAIATLREQPKKICTAEEARALPHIGRIAEKIEEIVNTKQLKQLEQARNDPDNKVLATFLKIYGAGPTQAKKWMSQGFRTLDDLASKAKLTTSQRIGLEHLEDLNTRIPRREVDALARCVKEAAAGIDRDVELIIGGSYRRGAESSSDIDLLMTKEGTSSIRQLSSFLDRLVEKLTRDGFLTAALATPRKGGPDAGSGSQWHGCCVLPKAAFPGPKEDYRPIWRRIDFLLVPETEIGAALIYFTGDDLFNRSIRLLANKKGMRLNQRGLYKDILIDPVNLKMIGGTLVEARDEKKIFEILGVPWREPHERWCD
ncbi:hypothetical protein GGS23DRAFT_597768 [Durotheca rogersii]|uniref:uncharacterized protein n=1 Tax=Durotheca rogersii TaxID=419775 RepID=UPI00222079E5|nr:uncharacterized protein GGS23DRAFT_597768 [Durotheca rogersii]KAI5862149.1 hypothetical protein GGS23DRAFT_597768 [Durotheca rogersii]